MPENRDPRKDPRPGDMVAKGAKQRRVDARRGSEIDYTDIQSGKKKNCWITTWNDWCRDAEVLHVAEA